MTGWDEVGVAEVCESIIDCVNKTAPTVTGPTPYKMIRTTNVRDGWINLNDVKYVDESTYRKWTRRQVPRKGDIILTREAPLGEVGMLRTDDEVFLGQRLVSCRVDPAKADHRFLLYAFQSHYLQSQIKALGSGATVEHMRVPDAQKLRFLLPPLPIQRRIASILSAYDDLIENNTRRIAILEEMARRLYEEWFVQFRFPGHEGNSQEDWERVPLGDLLANHIGGGWGKEVPDESHPCPGHVIRGTDIPSVRGFDLSRCPHRYHKVSNIRSRRLSPGDIVMEVSGGSHDQSVGRVLFVTEELTNAFGGEVICASFCKRLEVASDRIAPIFLYHHLAHAYSSKRMDEFQVQSTGIKNFQFKPFLQKEMVPVPPRELQGEFVETVMPMLHLHQRLGRKSANLRAQRDLLLPKLVSGEVDVSDIPMPDDKEFEAA